MKNSQRGSLHGVIEDLQLQNSHGGRAAHRAATWAGVGMFAARSIELSIRSCCWDQNSMAGNHDLWSEPMLMLPPLQPDRGGIEGLMIDEIRTRLPGVMVVGWSRRFSVVDSIVVLIFNTVCHAVFGLIVRRRLKLDQIWVRNKARCMR